MASIKVPSNVSSMTFSTSGVKAPVGGIISGLTPAEATAFSQQGNNGGNRYGPAKLVSTAANGNCVLSLPVVITAITINAIAYNVNGAATPWGKVLSAAVPAPAATTVLNENFSLVIG